MCPFYKVLKLISLILYCGLCLLFEKKNRDSSVKNKEREIAIPSHQDGISAQCKVSEEEGEEEKLKCTFGVFFTLS